MKLLARLAFACIAAASTASAATYTLDDPASPFSVLFNDAGGKFTITSKSTGWVWRNPDTLVSGTVPTSVTSVAVNGLTLTANIVISGATYSLTAQLRTSPSELQVTLGGAESTALSGVNYPHPFYSTDGQGYAVLPYDSGYVVPNTATTFTLPGGQRAMEWYGGTDANNQRGWVAIIDTPDDYELKVRSGTISSVNYLGAVMNWRGSNANSTHTANKLSYDRTVRFRFLDNGGYVALAKVFRAEATTRGYVKTLAQKQADSPSLDLSRFIGSPVCYLWGDGRSTALLDAMQAAGIGKAHIQVSINHTDQQKNFPATSLADNAWFDTIRAHGYTGGFYDIYAGMRNSGSGGSPYDGFYYLWPSNAYTDWAYITSSGTASASGGQASISNMKAADFAASTRLPAHISRFNMDAAFFDVVCATDLTEDYDTTNGHFATRGTDRKGRYNLLNAAYANPAKKLLTATEQGRSWAVPVLHWVEGKFWVGQQGAGLSDGAWDDPNVYPSITSDVIDPKATGSLTGLFGDGYSVPLWDLVYHDCVVNTTHWHRPHNKYLYGWDHQDRWAMLRGQAPLLHITYDGVQGLASRKPNTLADSSGAQQSTRWTVSHDHFVQTYNTVCKWHGSIGMMEMINHSRLTSDRSVQMSEFSSDGGASGRGIVVNFGTYDDTNGYGGSTWTGTQRGTALSVPVRSYVLYSWNSSATNNAPTLSFIAAQQTTSGTALGPLPFSVSDAETAAASLTVTASSSNTTLLPSASITLGGSGTDRTVTLTPASGQTGSTTVTLTVSDGTLTTSTSFVLNVYASINTPPTVTYLADQTSTTGSTVGPLSFTIGDAQTAASALTVTASSSNVSVLPTAGIVLGGSGASRTISLTAGSTAGTSTVTITVSDGSIYTQSIFDLTTTSSGNTAPTITSISNQTTSTGVAVGPLSFTVGDAETAAAALTVTGSSSNTTLLPNASITLGGSGASRTVTLSPASAQTGTSTVTLTVSDGSLTTSTTFTLTVGSGTNTAPTITTIPNQTTTSSVAVGPLPFTIGDAETSPASLILIRISSNTTLVPTTSIVFGGSGASRTVTVTPAAGQTGTANITLRVSDGSLLAQTTFVLTVNAANTAPTITSIASQYTTPQTAVGPVAFTIGDAETAAASLTVTAASSNTALLPLAGIALGGSGASRTFTLTPAAGQSGTSTVTLTVSDGTLTATASFSLTVSSGPQTVTTLAALHQNGQTYLTWNEVADSTATYRIYRSATPFTSTTQFTSGNLIGTAAADASYDTRLSTLRSTSYFYRITAAGPDLTATQGLFVHTPVADGTAYYAVTAVVSSVEQIALSAGQNTTSSVSETAAMPLPVFQRSLIISSRTVEVYVHWVGASDTAYYPAMGNQNSVAHHLGLVRNGTASTHSLVVRPHARQSSFLTTVTGTSDANEWVLTLDDWMPNTIENTFWYGFHDSFDINTGGPQTTSGTVCDYTTRRTKWEIEWALRTLPIDLNRVYMTGHSMGGIGSTFLGIMLRDKIAAIWTTSAKYDFSYLNDPNTTNIWNSGSNERATTGDIMWGTVQLNLPSSEGIPVYSRLNAGYLAAAFRGEDLPVFIAFNGKNDNVVGWAEKIGFYAAMNSNKHGGMFFWDSGVHNRTGGEFVPEQDINMLNRYRLNQSYPALSNSTVNGAPGDGNATNGDTCGTMNGNLDWDTSSIVDTTSQWQIRLLTVALSNTAASGQTIAAPASAAVDVTPRRLQAFPRTAGRAAYYEVRDAGSSLLKQGLIVSDADGLYTVPAVPVAPAGTLLTLTTVDQSSPAMASNGSGITLSWPTTAGVKYQVEWSSDLSQWFGIGSPTTATSQSMSWTDNGSQTGAAPGASGKRFYRLRLSV